MPPRKRLYNLEDAVEMVFADSPSEDEDLLDLPQSDSDYELRERYVLSLFVSISYVFGVIYSNSTLKMDAALLFSRTRSESRKTMGRCVLVNTYQ